MKNVITAAVISMMVMSVAAGGMPEELIEPTKTALETIEVVSPAPDTATLALLISWCSLSLWLCL